MGLFTQQVKDNYNNTRADSALKSLKPKDGKVHVIMLLSFSKIVNNFFGCDEKYTNEIDAAIVEMQNRGYEIIDIKINTLANQGLTGQREGYITCITYK